MYESHDSFVKAIWCFRKYFKIFKINLSLIYLKIYKIIGDIFKLMKPQKILCNKIVKKVLFDPQTTEKQTANITFSVSK